MATIMTMRILHRYLGFFLAGIMFVYALSGVMLIFRRTDYFKKEVTVEKTLDPGLEAPVVAEQLKLKEKELESRTVDQLRFPTATYDVSTGEAVYTKMEYPYVLDQMAHLHKATTNDPLYYLNIFFGVGLLFFVVSAFFMFMPGSTILRKGLWFSLAGVVLTLVLLFL